MYGWCCGGFQSQSISATGAIRYSKIDPYGAGIHIFLDHTRDMNLYPVTAVLQHLAIHPWTPGPLQTKVPTYMTLLVRHVRQALLQARIDILKYSGHSFRIGAATTAAKQGLETPLSRCLVARWKSSEFSISALQLMNSLLSLEDWPGTHSCLFSPFSFYPTIPLCITNFIVG